MPRGKSQRSLRLIDAAYDILAEIHPATVRAVCYRLFTAGLIPSMATKETQRVSKQLVDAREDETIPWDWIVDETRQAERVAQWSDPAAYAKAVQRSYRRDRWTEQPRQVEVWSEKGTVRGTLKPVLDAYGVRFRVFHGFGSATAVHDVADDSWFGDEPLLALYIGDWDPSGLCMSERDLPDRLERYEGNVEIRRIALTEYDIAEGNLPSFPVESKKGDSRYRWFRQHFGTRCWELDALSPVVLRDRAEDAIWLEIDHDAWERAARVEEAERASLIDVLKAWEEAKAA
jgi:hypothetical protein